MGAAGPYWVTAHPVSWQPYDLPADDDRQINSEDRMSVRLRVRPPPTGTHRCHGATPSGRGDHAHSQVTGRHPKSMPNMWVYPGFPTPFWGLSGFFVGDLIGKALWELVENAQRFPRHGGRVLCVHGAVSFHRARPCATRWLPGRGPCVMSNWTAASSDCSRPANNNVRVNTVDLYTPNARFTTERLVYQVLTLFWKLGYSPICCVQAQTRSPCLVGNSTEFSST